VVPEKAKRIVPARMLADHERIARRLRLRAQRRALAGAAATDEVNRGVD